MAWIINIFICGIVLLILHLLFPVWYWIIIVPFVFSFVRLKSGWTAFVTGAVSTGLVWFLGSLCYWISSGEYITARVASMMKFNSPWILIGITIGIAFITGGFAATSGVLLKKVFQK